MIFCLYVGVGLNYIIFFDESFNGMGINVGLSDLKFDDLWGFVVNVGFDYMFNDSWFFNVFVWYVNIEIMVIYKVGVDVKFMDVEINFWVFMIVGGYKF